jgi:enamine deaminase RidA (YjgF/YER057c/UK114 family)
MLFDFLAKNRLPTKALGRTRLWLLRDKTKDIWYPDGDGNVLPLTGSISALCTGDGSTTSFTIGTVPKDCIVDGVNVAIVGTAGTAATTIALGYSGTTAAFHAASNFTASMDTAGAKATTVVRAHLTAEKTALATFSAAWDSGAKAIVTIRWTRCVPSS